MKQIKRVIPLLDQAIVSGGNFLLGILLARVLGLEIYGEFAIVWLVVLFCSSIHHAWIITPLYTFISKYVDQERDKYINSIIVHQFLFAAIAMVLVWSIVLIGKFYFPEWEISKASDLVPFTVLSYLMYDFFRRLAYSKSIIYKALIIDCLVYLTQAICLLILNLKGLLDLKNCLIVITISYTLVFFLELKTLVSLKIELSRCIQTAQEHWRFSRWLIGTSLLQWVSGNFFILAAGGILGPIIVGAIRILQNIMGVLHVLFLALENQVPIKASNILKAKGIPSMFQYIKGVIYKGSLFTLLLASLIAVFGNQIISLLYSGKHVEYAYLLYGFGALYVLVFVGTGLRFAIRTLEKTKAIFIAYVLSTIFSLLSAKMIINQFGIVGVLIGLIATQLIMQLYFIYILKNEYSIKNNVMASGKVNPRFINH